MGKVVLTNPWKVVFQKFSLLVVQLSYFELLKACQKNKRGKNQKDSELQAVVVDATKHEENERKRRVVSALVKHFRLKHCVVIEEIN